jgi:hypothetical protein
MKDFQGMLYCVSVCKMSFYKKTKREREREYHPVVASTENYKWTIYSSLHTIKSRVCTTQ